MPDMRNNVPVVTAVVAVALIVGVSSWMARGPTPAASPDGARAVVPAAPTAAINTRAASARTPLPPAPAPVADLLATMEANRAGASKLAEAGKQKLQSRYEGERVDVAWAAAKQQVLERLSVSPQITQLGAQPLAIQAHCRTSVCRIEADFATRVAADDWHTLYTLNAGTEMSNSSATGSLNPDGTVHLQIYGLARQ